MRGLLAAGTDPYQETTDGRSAITSAFQYYLSEETELAETMPVFESLELSVLHMAVIEVLHVSNEEVLCKPEYLSGLNKVEGNMRRCILRRFGETQKLRGI